MKKKKGPRAELVIVQTLNNFLQQIKLRTIYIAEGNLPPPELSFFVNFPRLDILLSGSLELQIETNGVSRKIILKRGDVVFIPPNSWNKPLTGHASQVLSILFGKKQTGFSLVTYEREMDSRFRGNDNRGRNSNRSRHNSRNENRIKVVKASLKLEMDNPIWKILAALSATCENPSPLPPAKLLIQAILLLLTQALKQPIRLKYSKARITFDSICAYVQENFSKPINRDLVAAHFHLNPNHLSRLFRKRGLMKFCDYLNFVRIDRAKFLLKKYEMTLAEIAAACGYNDPGYFCRIFKKITKKTPTEFRAKNK
ncbi:MAG: AraC family transcriptional regulator [Pseudomonadota bacterium]